MAITLADIARHCGVSTSTVSLALRDHPRISAATASRVKNAAKNLGYTPNRSVSRVMSEIRTQGQTRAYKESLGYVTADINQLSHNYEKRIFSGITARAEQLGYRIDRFELGSNGLTPKQLGRVLVSRGIRGLMLAPWPEAQAELDLDWERLAPVSIGYTLSQPELHRVARDVMHTLRGVFERLNVFGYRRIGFVMERGHEERMDYMTLAAYQLNSLLTQSSSPIPPLMEESVHEDLFWEWFDANRPDAILTMHRLVYDWLVASDIGIPDDIGLYVFNCESEESKFSGIYPAYENIGAAAVEQVAALLERGGFGIPSNPTTTLVPGIPCKGSTMRL